MPRRFLLPLLTTFTLVSVSACRMTGAEGGSVEALPAAWKNAAGFPVSSPDRDLTEWWTKFDDPLLPRVIEGALRHSPDITAAAARVREARAQRKAQAASLFPSVDASVNRSSTWTRVEAAPNRSDTAYGAGLSASWDADLFGAIRQNVAAASAAAEASLEDFHSAQASLAAETALAYVDLRSSEERLRVVRESLRTRTETTQLVEWRQRSGEVDNLELRQAQSSLEQARASLSSLEQSASRTRNRLALLSGFNPGTLDGLLSVKSPKVPVPSRRLAVGIPADTIRQRPDVRATGYRWVASVARTRAAEAGRLPSLGLSGRLGVDTLSAGKFFNPESAGGSIVAGLTGPIFNAGRIRAGIEAAGAAQEQALMAYQTSVLTALSEVEDALIGCRRSQERLEILARAEDDARGADELARLRYRTGGADFTTVLDTQRTLLSIGESLVAARADRAAAHIQLYKALGGGWTAR